MKDNISFEIIARVHTDFSEKFGIPRQSGLVKNLKGKIVFEPKYRDISALKGLDGFSHLWLIWKFSQAVSEDWSPTVRPPRLGGNKRMGVFATRAPYRPNDIGLSCVRLEKISFDPKIGPVLHVAGADLMDGTPIYDIKPYIAYTDSHPEASEGFAGTVKEKELSVEFPQALLENYPEEKRAAILAVLKQDPRPAYDTDETRVYGVEFAGFDVRFTVQGTLLTVKDVVKR